MNYICILREKRFTTYITWLMRLIVGAVFIFSGFSKAIDPWGTFYKFSEYAEALRLFPGPNLILIGVFFLFTVEFLTGVFILLGCFRRSAVWLAALIMAFMLPLTLWIAISDPVSDCGCFGDALILSNWATFWKNVGLSIPIIWLLLFNRQSHWVITPALQWLSFIASGAYIIVLGFYSYECQPLIDFRPYPEGAHLFDSKNFQPSDAADNIVFVYEKDGVTKEYGIDDEIPDESDGWTFVKRIEKHSEVKDGEALSDFHFFDEENNDVTAEVLSESTDHILLMMPDINAVSAATTWRINSLYDWCEKNGLSMEAIAAGNVEEIELWKDLSMPSYPIYFSDDTLIKEVVRGNPGVVYLHDGVIKWKNALRAIDTDDFMAPETSKNPMSFYVDRKSLLLNFTYLYLIITAVLIALSFVPSLKNVFSGKSKRWQKFVSARANQTSMKEPANHDDKAHPEE